MESTTSLVKTESNRRNALKSTGPRTLAGLTVSSMNAIKHGILSKDVLVRGTSFKVDARALAALHQRFREDLQPAGVTEEMLVERIVAAHWRLRRVMRAESATIALGVDGSKKFRDRFNSDEAVEARWQVKSDPYDAMLQTSLGNTLLQFWLEEAQRAVMRDGELTEATFKEFESRFDGGPNLLTMDLDRLRSSWATNTKGLPPAVFAAERKKATLSFLELEIRATQHNGKKCARRERREELTHQAAATLPSDEMLDRILRYESTIEKQLSRAMNQLERLQRMRNGEAIPAPLAVDVCATDEKIFFAKRTQIDVVNQQVAKQERQ